jgi:hypothetical protein
MDLEPGEERLSFGTEGEGTATQIVRAGTQVFGKGKRQTTTEEFRNTIAHIRDTTPAPESKNPNKRSSKMEVTPTGPPQLIWDVAEVLRSKNAGPYDISIDIMFYSEVAYHIVKDSNFLTHERVAQALGVTEEDIIWIGFFEPAFAFKVTIPRLRGGKKVSAGGFMEDDIHGSQKHMELALMKLPSALSFPAESLVSR